MNASKRLTYKQAYLYTCLHAYILYTYACLHVYHTYIHAYIRIVTYSDSYTLSWMNNTGSVSFWICKYGSRYRRSIICVGFSYLLKCLDVRRHVVYGDLPYKLTFTFKYRTFYTFRWLPILNYHIYSLLVNKIPFVSILSCRNFENMTYN